MTDRFTAEDAFDAADCGDPIVMQPEAAHKMVADHAASWDEWQTDCTDPARLYHADAILAWLGY